MSHKYIFGLRGEEIVHISDVDKGLNCNVICPLCKSKLVAKKGSKNKHHFTHHNNDECRGGIETSLHLAAKDILSKSKEFRIKDNPILSQSHTSSPSLLIRFHVIKKGLFSPFLINCVHIFMSV